MAGKRVVDEKRIAELSDEFNSGVLALAAEFQAALSELHGAECSVRLDWSWSPPRSEDAGRPVVRTAWTWRRP